MKKLANPPQKFARALAHALEDTAPYRRQPVGPDARMLVVSSRLLPTAAMHQMSRLAMGLPGTGALRPGFADLTASQRAMIKAAEVLPEPVMTRIAMLAMRFAPKPKDQKDNNA